MQFTLRDGLGIDYPMTFNSLETATYFAQESQQYRNPADRVASIRDTYGNLLWEKK